MEFPTRHHFLSHEKNQSYSSLNDGGTLYVILEYGDTSDDADTGVYTAKAEVSDHTTFYVEPTFYANENIGIYVKGGVSQITVTSLESIEVLTKASRKLGQDRATEPAIEEIAAELEVPAEEVLETILSARAVCSLDESFTDDDERSLLNTLADDTTETPDADVLRESARVQLESALSTLEERELRIIRLYFGLDGNEALTLEEIGDMMNLTRERIRQLKERALSKLRHPSRHQALKTLASEV